MLAVASLKRSLEFDPVEQGVKRKRAEMKLSSPTFTMNNTSSSSPKQQSIFPSSSTKKQSLKSCSLTTLTSSTDNIPMFTYTQTAQMCTRLLHEQDKSIREQYEQLLTTKLNEQYEQFVRYSHDSVHKNSSKQQQQRFFHFGQPQNSDDTSIAAFSYVS